MKRLILVLALFAVAGTAAAEERCLIVKHKGTVGRRIMWTALVGVPIAPGSKYDYVDAVNYTTKKVRFKDKDLEKIQAEGVRVTVLDKPSAYQINAIRTECARPEAPKPAPVIAQPKQTAPPAAQPAPPVEKSVADVAREYRARKAAQQKLEQQ